MHPSIDLLLENGFIEEAEMLRTKIAARFAEEAEQRRLDREVCPECGETRIQTGTGYLVCPNGHGKLYGVDCDDGEIDRNLMQRLRAIATDTCADASATEAILIEVEDHIDGLRNEFLDAWG